MHGNGKAKSSNKLVDYVVFFLHRYFTGLFFSTGVLMEKEKRKKERKTEEKERLRIDSS